MKEYRATYFRKYNSVYYSITFIPVCTYHTINFKFREMYMFHTPQKEVIYAGCLHYVGHYFFGCYTNW